MFKLPHRVDYITILPFEINRIIAEDDIASSCLPLYKGRVGGVT